MRQSLDLFGIGDALFQWEYDEDAQEESHCDAHDHLFNDHGSQHQLLLKADYKYTLPTLVGEHEIDPTPPLKHVTLQLQMLMIPYTDTASFNV